MGGFVAAAHHAVAVHALVGLEGAVLITVFSMLANVEAAALALVAHGSDGGNDSRRAQGAVRVKAAVASAADRAAVRAVGAVLADVVAASSLTVNGQGRVAEADPAVERIAQVVLELA